MIVITSKPKHGGQIIVLVTLHIWTDLCNSVSTYACLVCYISILRAVAHPLFSCHCRKCCYQLCTVAADCLAASAVSQLMAIIIKFPYSCL